MQFAFKHIDNMAAIAPMIRDIPRRILHNSHPDISVVQSSPERCARLAFVLNPRQGTPGDFGEGQWRQFHF
jgi:hypothetical protein